MFVRKELILQHDNTRLLTSTATSAVTENIGFEVVPCRPYSMDLALFGLWWFAALKKHLEGMHFTCDEV